MLFSVEGSFTSVFFLSGSPCTRQRMAMDIRGGDFAWHIFLRRFSVIGNTMSRNGHIVLDIPSLLVERDISALFYTYVGTWSGCHLQEPPCS